MAKGKRRDSKDLISLARNDSALRKKLFADLKRHIVAGYSLDCWDVMGQLTIEDFLTKYPEEFDAEELLAAQRKGKLGWENIGRRQAEGTCLGNSRAWYYNMAQRYGWSERQQIDLKHDGQVNVAIVSYADTIMKPQ